MRGAAQLVVVKAREVAPKATTPMREMDSGSVPSGPDNLTLAVRACPWGPEEETWANLSRLGKSFCTQMAPEGGSGGGVR